MPRKEYFVEGVVSPAEALRFSEIAHEVITSPKYRMAGRAPRKGAEEEPHIGTLRDKRLHAAVMCNRFCGQGKKESNIVFSSFLCG